MNGINRVAVLGSGVMGGAIAAHLANCGIPSLVLDIVPKDAPADNPAARNAIAAKSVKALLKTKPAPLYLSSNINLIEVGNFEDDMARIADCDWVIEVVKEDVAIKRLVFEQVKQHRKPGTILSTNTSGIPLHSMVEVMDDDMRKNFLGTHFFNPPRYLHLVEIIPTPDTDPNVIAFMAEFLENTVGKGVVYAKDTPNFIANRVLTFASQFILNETVNAGLTVEEVDALTGTNIGHASSATFRTFDLVGLDTYALVSGNLYNNCPDDERRDLMTVPAWVQGMLDKGLLGTKTGSGFYKKTNKRDEKGKRVILAIDPDTLEYRDPMKPRFDCIGKARKIDDLEEKVRVMHAGGDKGSDFLRKLFAHLAHYTAMRVPEIADDIVNIDNAVRWGFAWEIGIFETWDALGVQAVCDLMKEEGLDLPPLVQALLDAGLDSFYASANGEQQYFDLESKGYKAVPSNPAAIDLKTTKHAGAVVKENKHCSLIDLDDGIVCAEFHSKMNSIDRLMIEMILEGVGLVNDGQFDGMVLANQGPHFCVGANLMLVLGNIMQKNWDAVDKESDGFQQANMAMRFCRGPVVAAPHHYCMGGGIEMSQHTARCVIAGETYGGLVEVGVGVIPGGGGCKEMLRRSLAYVPSSVKDGDAFPYIRRAFEAIGMAKVSTSGAELIDIGYLSENDVVCVNFHQQVRKAKDVCRGLVVAGYTPPRPATLYALGEDARAAFRSGVYGLQLGGFASEHDALIAEKLAYILTGGDRLPGTPITEQDVLDLEREAFVSLCGTAETQARIQHMLQTGKPLRN
jgi:3-hydroxyacyl-CoA dehydrogenase